MPRATLQRLSGCRQRQRVGVGRSRLKHPRTRGSPHVVPSLERVSKLRVCIQNMGSGNDSLQVSHALSHVYRLFSTLGTYVIDACMYVHLAKRQNKMCCAITCPSFHPAHTPSKMVCISHSHCNWLHDTHTHTHTHTPTAGRSPALAALARMCVVHACVCDTFGRSGSESFQNHENTCTHRVRTYRTSSHLSARLRESGQVVTRQPRDDGKESIVVDRVQSGMPLHGATHGGAQAAIEEAAFADCQRPRKRSNAHGAGPFFQEMEK